MNRYYSWRSRANVRGFTLVELLIVVAIMGVLIALLAPAVFNAGEGAKTANCLQRLRQQHQFYTKAVADTTAGKITDPSRRVNAKTIKIFTERYAQKESAGEEIWQCPSNPASITELTSYGYNSRLHRMSDKSDNTRIMALDYERPVVDGSFDHWMVEVPGWASANTANGNWSGFMAPRHARSVNVYYHSGRGDTIDPESIDPNVAENQLRYWIPKRDQAGINRASPIKEFTVVPDPPTGFGQSKF